MSTEREDPSEKVIAAMAAQGLTQDSPDRTKFVNGMGTVEAYGDGDWYYDGKTWTRVR